MSARAKRPTTKPPPRAKRGSRVQFNDTPTEVDRPARSSAEDAKTGIFDSGRVPKQPAMQIQSISMKTPHASKQKTPDVDAVQVRKVKLRAISEVSPLKEAQPKNLGYLAPPRDPNEATKRKLRDYVVVVSLSVIVASVIALIIWFAAR